jgi:hypothetical protein
VSVRLLSIIGCSFVLVLAGAGAASGAVLYSKTEAVSEVPECHESEGMRLCIYPTNAFASQDSVVQLADDFTVPSGQAWTISHVDVQGSYSGEAGALPVVVALYANAGSIPGTEIFSEQNNTGPGFPNYSIPISGAPALTPGTYWLKVEALGPKSISIWRWDLSPVQSAYPAVVFDSSKSAACNPGPRDTCDPSLAGPPAPGQIFTLSGTASPYTSPALPDTGGSSNTTPLPAPAPKPKVCTRGFVKKRGKCVRRHRRHRHHGRHSR